MVWIRIDHGWTFPATSHIRNKIDLKLGENDDDVTTAIVLDFSSVNFLDFTSANAIRVRSSLQLKSHWAYLGLLGRALGNSKRS